MLDFYQKQLENGAWPQSCDSTVKPGCKYDYMEKSHAMFAQGTPREVFIVEPCNYASNIAYYHSAVRTCEYPWSMPEEYSRAIKQGFVTLSSGSAFKHGGETRLGGDYDNNMISIISFTGYRALMAKLNITSNVMMSLNSDGSVAMDPLELSSQISYLPLNQNVSTWHDQIHAW